MDFDSTFCGSAKFESEFGIVVCHSICLISWVKFAVQHVAVDVVAWLDLVPPVQLLAKDPFPKPILSRHAIVDATVLGWFTLLAGAIRCELLPLRVISR